MAAREKVPTRGMLKILPKVPKSIAGGVGEDIFTPRVYGNRSQRLWPVATFRPSSANRDLYTGGGLCLMGHVQIPDESRAWNWMTEFKFLCKGKRTLEMSFSVKRRWTWDSKSRLNFLIKDRTTRVHEVDELNPHFVKETTSIEGKISIELSMDLKSTRVLVMDLYNGDGFCWLKSIWLNGRLVFAGRRSTRCRKSGWKRLQDTTTSAFTVGGEWHRLLTLLWTRWWIRIELFFSK